MNEDVSKNHDDNDDQVFQAMFKYLTEESLTNTSTVFDQELPRRLNFSVFKERYNTSTIGNIKTSKTKNAFIEYESEDIDMMSNEHNNNTITESHTVTKKNLIELLYSKKTRIVDNNEQYNDSEMIADGSSSSIILWSLKEETISKIVNGISTESTIKMDKDQRKSISVNCI